MRSVMLTAAIAIFGALTVLQPVSAKADPTSCSGAGVTTGVANLASVTYDNSIPAVQLTFNDPSGGNGITTYCGGTVFHTPQASVYLTVDESSGSSVNEVCAKLAGNAFGLSDVNNTLQLTATSNSDGDVMVDNQDTISTFIQITGSPQVYCQLRRGLQ